MEYLSIIKTGLEYMTLSSSVFPECGLVSGWVYIDIPAASAGLIPHFHFKNKTPTVLGEHQLLPAAATGATLIDFGFG